MPKQAKKKIVFYVYNSIGGGSYYLKKSSPYEVSALVVRETPKLYKIEDEIALSCAYKSFGMRIEKDSQDVFGTLEEALEERKKRNEMVLEWFEKRVEEVRATLDNGDDALREKAAKLFLLD